MSTETIRFIRDRKSASSKDFIHFWATRAMNKSQWTSDQRPPEKNKNKITQKKWSEKKGNLRRRLHSCENTKGSKKLASKEGRSLMRTVFQQGFHSSATGTVPCFLLRPQAEKLHSSSLTSSSLCSSGSEWGRGVVRHGWLGSDWSVAPAPLWTLSPSGAPSPPETCVTLVCFNKGIC